jgi:hypothetical protein
MAHPGLSLQARRVLPLSGTHCAHGKSEEEAQEAKDMVANPAWLNQCHKLDSEFHDGSSQRRFFELQPITS